MKAVDTVKILGLGIVIALLAMIALNRSAAVNAADAASAGSIIALTAASTNITKGYTYLFLVDTSQKYVAVYSLDDTYFGLAAARYIGYDLGINEIDKFRAKQPLSVKDAKKAYEESRKSQP